jgi:hypothetical protein
MVQKLNPGVSCDENDDPNDCVNQPLYLCAMEFVLNNGQITPSGENKCMKQINRRSNGLACSEHKECISLFCNTTATSGSIKKCQCKKNAPVNDKVCGALSVDDCASSGCFYDDEVEPAAVCKSLQGKCSLADSCAVDTDCVAGTKCDPDTLECVPKCNLVNTAGDCNLGDVCGRNEACGKHGYSNNNNTYQMFCQGLSQTTFDSNAPVTASVDAGTCQVWGCVNEGQDCLGDSDCCYGTCDWTLDAGSDNMNGKCKETVNSMQSSEGEQRARDPRSFRSSKV